MRQIDDPIDVLSSLPPISLDALETEAAFLTRMDRKYLVPVAAAAELLAGLDPASRVLEMAGRRSFGYLTPYFDDDGYSAYMGAARRRPNRFKVRTRLYTDSGICQLEVKVRDARGLTVKHRIDHNPGYLEQLDGDERHWLGDFPQVAPFTNDIRHRMSTYYQRSTIVLPGAEGRVTIDRDLFFTLPSGEALTLPNLVVIETKGGGRPTPVDRLLWRAGYRPQPMSKFAAGLSLLVPELPANRWHRVRSMLANAAVVKAPPSSRASSLPAPNLSLVPDPVTAPAFRLLRTDRHGTLTAD